MSTSDVNPKNSKNTGNKTNDIDDETVSENETSKHNSPDYDYAETKNLIHKNIDYEHYYKYKDDPRSLDIRLIDELVDCMLDVICTKGESVKINSELKNRQIVIEKYLSLNSDDIRHIIMKYEEQHGKITHINAYLKTLLYTVKQENNFYYTNAVRADDLL